MEQVGLALYGTKFKRHNCHDQMDGYGAHWSGVEESLVLDVG